MLALVLLALQQPAASVVATVRVTPENPIVAVGDSVHLTGVALDSAGRPLAGAEVRFFGGSFEGRVDSTGWAKGGAPGNMRVFAVPMVPGGRPSRPTEVMVHIVPGPAARVAVPAIGRLVVGQRLALDAPVFAANGDRRDDVARWSSSSPSVVSVERLPTAEFWPHPDGKHAYLSTIGDRVYALDISDPHNPRITDSVVVDARVVNDVMTTADGKWGVLTREGASSRRNGIVILSFEDPAHPKAVAEFTETVTGGVHSTYVYSQAKYGTHVY